MRGMGPKPLYPLLCQMHIRARQIPAERVMYCAIANM